jgi:SAM-dependent methyltransferase
VSWQCYNVPVSETPEEAPPSLSVNPRTAGEFDAFYTGTPPWDIGRPQGAFRRLAESGLITGRVLDVGCGTGEHALMCAGLGLATTGIDAAPSAIGLAKRKAEERGLDVRFMVGDALDLGALGEQYDTVLDSGLFHTFEDKERSRYVQSLREAAAPGGRYYMLCFTDQQPGDWGPRRVSQAEIRASFAAGWQVGGIEAATFEVNLGPGSPAGGDGALAWLVTIIRT